VTVPPVAVMGLKLFVLAVPGEKLNLNDASIGILSSKS
jgi:hypothetical protein